MYDFESGLSQVERLEVLTASPLLRLSSECLPRHGMSTKPAVADPAALMVLGAATVTFGSDRAADRELRAHWPRLRDTFEEAGLRVPDRALRAQHFRYYRDRILGGGLPEEWKASARDLFRGLALEIGLFPEVASSWIDPHPDGIVSSDGTWFAAASEVVDMSTSRSTTGRPRVVGDADRKHKYDRKGLGYMVCITSVRGSAQRQRVVLDVSFAPNSAEMDVVIPTIANLRDHLGDRLRCVVFDGAMRGVHHRALRSLGVLTVNKPAGSRRLDQWRAHIDTVVGQEAKVLRIDSGCVHEHLVTVTAGMFWELEPSGGGKYRRRRVLNPRPAGDVPEAVALPGTRRLRPRTVELTDWATTILTRRLAELPDDPDTLLAYNGHAREGTVARHAAACRLIAAVLHTSGLDTEPDIRPVSVRNWRARAAFDAGASIEDVATMLGHRRLDEAADAIGHDWTTQ